MWLYLSLCPGQAHKIAFTVSNSHSARRQTGAGKTYTMLGGRDSYKSRGLVPRCISRVFEEIRRSPDLTRTVRMSYVEIYNEHIYDLLNPAQVRLLGLCGGRSCEQHVRTSRFATSRAMEGPGFLIVRIIELTRAFIVHPAGPRCDSDRGRPPGLGAGAGGVVPRGDDGAGRPAAHVRGKSVVSDVENNCAISFLQDARAVQLVCCRVS